MPIDIPRISVRDQDRLVSSVPGPSLLYAADGTGGASSSLGNLVVSLPTVAAHEVVEISLPPVASLLPVVSLPTVATEIPAVSLPTVATEIPPQSTALATTSGLAGNSSNEGPRALTVSNSLIDNCEAETRIDHQVDDDDERVSPNSILTIDGLDSSSSSDGGSSESSQSNNKSRKRSRSPSVDRRSDFKKPTSRRDDNNRDTSSRYGNYGERQQSRNYRSDDGQQHNRSSDQNRPDYSDNWNSNKNRNQF